MLEQLNIESPYLHEFSTVLDSQDEEIEVLVEQIAELIKNKTDN
jgi:hypothetical protein